MRSSARWTTAPTTWRPASSCAPPAGSERSARSGWRWPMSRRAAALTAAPSSCPGGTDMGFFKRLFRDSGPLSATASIQRGRVYLAEGRYDRAIAAFTAAIRLDSSNATAHGNRGLAYQEAGDYEAAIADYTEAIRRDPHGADTYLRRGDAYFAQDDFDRAIDDYGEAIALDPGLAPAYYHRALAQVEKGHAVRGKADRQKAARFDPAL